MLLRLILDVSAPAGRGSRLSVLIFHRVRPTIDPLFPGEPDALRFEQQLRWVKGWFQVLPLPEAIMGLREGKLPARPLCITFDDGYADNATLALPILRKLGLTATFFVATGYLNGGRMWNDTVIEAVRAATGPRLDLSDLQLGAFDLDGVSAKRSAIDFILTSLKHLPIAERQRRTDQIAARAEAELPHDLMLNDSQVRNLRAADMTIGAHTVSHPILAKLDDETAWREIAESKRYLEALLDEPISLFAYPNGKPIRDYTAAHVSMTRELGFAAAMSTAAGVGHYGCDLFQIPRLTPWDRTPSRYGLRLALNARQTNYATA